MKFQIPILRWIGTPTAASRRGRSPHWLLLHLYEIMKIIFKQKRQLFFALLFFEINEAKLIICYKSSAMQSLLSVENSYLEDYVFDSKIL